MTLSSVRRRSAWFSILFSLLVPLRAGVEAVACKIGPEGEELRYMLFNPDVSGNKAWWTFFYNYRYTYLDGAVTSHADERALCREWIAELGRDIPVADAYACLYTALPDSARRRNAFYQALRANPPLHRYYQFANDQVGRVGVPADPWQEVDEDSVRLTGEQLIRTGQKLYAAAETPFLKKRYAYQLLKLAYYHGEEALFDQLYDWHFRLGAAPSQLDWWAAHYQSMRLEGRRPDSANYLHARVYSHADAKMPASRQFYSTKNHAQVMALAQNDGERADILVLKEAINPGRSLEGIRQVYALDSTHKHLSMLLVREINKLEDWLGTTQYIGMAPLSQWVDYDYSDDETLADQETLLRNWKSDYAYLTAFYASLSGMQAVARAYPDLYHLALAYLALMQQRPEAADGHLARVSASNTQVAFQAKVLRLVGLTQATDLAAPAVQERIGQSFTELIAARESVFEAQKTLYSLSAYLKSRFAAAGLNHLAGLLDYYQQELFCYSCRTHSPEYALVRYFDRSGSIADVRRVIALFSKPDRNALEKQLLLPYANPYPLLDLLSVKYLRRGDVAAAHGALAEIPDSFWTTYFNAGEWLDHDPFEASGAPSLESYTKTELLDRVLALEREAAAQPARRARNYFLLGNFWYNLNGKTWFMVAYEKTYARPNAWGAGEVNAWQKAKAYYGLALQSETDAERRAEMSYRMAECAARSESKAAFARQARQYEAYRNTRFYRNQNCLTTRNLAGR